MGNSTTQPIDEVVVDLDYETVVASIKETCTTTQIKLLKRVVPPKVEKNYPDNNCTLLDQDTGLNYGSVPNLAIDYSRFDSVDHSQHKKFDKFTNSEASHDGVMVNGYGNTASAKSSAVGVEVSKLWQEYLTSSFIQVEIYGSSQNHFSFLHPEILPHIISFLINDVGISRCFSICPNWFMHFYKTMLKMCEPITDKFVKTYKDNKLQVKYVTLSMQPLFTSCPAKIRCDYLLYCKVLKPCMSQCSQIGFTFVYEQPVSRITSDNDTNEEEIIRDPLMSSRLLAEDAVTKSNVSSMPESIISKNIIPAKYSSYSNDSVQSRYTVLYRFQTQKKNSYRKIWLQRDLCRFHGDELMVASTASVPTVNVEDYVEIPVNIANGFGTIDINSINWLPFEFISPAESDYGRKCLFERETATWQSLDNYQQTTTERLQENADSYSPHWTHIKTEFTGIDISLSRSVYRADKLGDVPSAHRLLGINCVVRPKTSKIAATLTRLGLQHDRFTWLHLRQGDYITVYVSQGGGVIQ